MITVAVIVGTVALAGICAAWDYGRHVLRLRENAAVADFSHRLKQCERALDACDSLNVRVNKLEQARQQENLAKMGRR
jgi:hypothetical protein